MAKKRPKRVSHCQRKPAKPHDTCNAESFEQAEPSAETWKEVADEDSWMDRIPWAAVILGIIILIIVFVAVPCNIQGAEASVDVRAPGVSVVVGEGRGVSVDVAWARPFLPIFVVPQPRVVPYYVPRRSVETYDSMHFRHRYRGRWK